MSTAVGVVGKGVASIIVKLVNEPQHDGSGNFKNECRIVIANRNLIGNAMPHNIRNSDN